MQHKLYEGLSAKPSGVPSPFTARRGFSQAVDKFEACSFQGSKEMAIGFPQLRDMWSKQLYRARSKLMLRKDAAFRRPLRLIFLASGIGLIFQVWTAWQGYQESSSPFVPAGRQHQPDRLRQTVRFGSTDPLDNTHASQSQYDWEGEGLWKTVTVFNAACWGSSYISSKAGIDALSAAGVEDAPIVFGALRFGLAALPLLPWVLRSSAAESARTSAIVGSLNGLSYAAIFTSYAYGTTGGKAAFITSLQTIVVAACTSLATKRFQLGTVVSAIMAVVGVGFLELAGGPMETTLGD